MKKLFPYLFILLTVCIFFKPFFLNGLLPIPSDDIVGLYNPFRDALAKDYPRGIPYKNYLITDPVRQEYPWKFLAITLEKKLQLPLWNPYSFSGYPLLANFQSAAFYPLNLVFFILPFRLAWGVFIFLQPLLAGLFLYLYLRHLKLNNAASLLGGVAFMFCGFSTVWLEWGNVLSTILWVPLILLAKDHLVTSWQKKWVIIFLFAEVASLLAGHLQIWFYCLLLTNVYLFLRLYENVRESHAKQFIREFAKRYIPFALVGLGMVAITAIQWAPTLQFISLSARSTDQNYLTTAGWFLPWQHLVQFIAPDFFGNPATLNYFGIWNYAEFVGYIGIIPIIFVVFALFFKRDKITIFFSCVTVLSLVFALPTLFAAIPFQLHVPFLSTSQPTRLMAIVNFSLVILAAIGFDTFLRTKNRKVFYAVGVVAICVGILWVVVIGHIGLSLDFARVAKQNLYLPTALLLIEAVILMGVIWKKQGIISQIFIFVLLLVTVFDLLRFANKFTPFTPSTYLFPQDSVLSFLQKNIGNYRFMTTDARIFSSNFSDMYKLQSVGGYDPLYLKSYAELISSSERMKPDISAPFGFNRIIEPQRYDSPIMALLGVKYVLSLSDISMPAFHEVFREGETRVYENSRVLPRVFFVGKIIPVKTSQEAINQIFANYQSLQSIAIVTDKLPGTRLPVGISVISSYEPNEIHIKTYNSQKGFLVLTDVYYPTWHAYIDGKEVKIYITDLTLRGVTVPPGNHTITFSDKIF